ncbi:Sb-PDE family phosphodiesterase, partial [bacterium]|nr:Sb-PDE family phosphodiesterase [bacterium]
LTMLGNSDVHDPVFMEYDPYGGDRRTVTLVFATENSENAIREALFAHRTAVLCRDTLYGVESQLRPLYEASFELVNPELTITGKGTALLQVRNLSDLPFHLAATDSLTELHFPPTVTLEPRAVVCLSLSARADSLSGVRQIRLPYVVRNVHPAPGVPLNAPLTVKVTFIPAAKK